MMRSLLDKLPAWPTIAISFYFFIKPVLPEPHLWQKIQMLIESQPMGHIDYLDIALHTFMGVVFFARTGRMIEVWLQRRHGGPVETAGENASLDSEGPDADR